MYKSLLLFIAGLIPLYFMDSAFKINPFNTEMLIHSSLRFLAGFLVLGIGVFYSHKIKLKFALIFLLVLATTDDIWDYIRNVDSFYPEVMIHSTYVLLWGASVGYMVMKWLLEERDYGE